MTDILYKNMLAASDTVLMQNIGSFIKYQRVRQNKTQDQLAKEAGIVRSTLSLCERGKNISLLVLIQILRALNLLHLLKEFEITQQYSPIQLAKLEMAQRTRVRRKGIEQEVVVPKSEW